MPQNYAALFLSAALAVLGPSAHAAPLGDTDAAITVAISDWTGQHITAHVYGSVLQKMGYKINYVTAGAIPQLSGIASGSLSAQPEIWNNGIGAVFSEAVARKEIEDIGDLGLNAMDGWIYNEATRKACPGLPDWKALKEPACADALSTPDTFPNGRLLDYPADWGTASAGVIRNAQLPFQAVPAGSEGALVAELQSAAASNTPILMRFWSPHWILAQVPVEWLDMPPCEATGDDRALVCIDKPPVVKVLWPGFAAKWPAGYEMSKLFKLTAEQQQQMIYAIDQEKKPLERVVAEWIAANEAIWKTWISKSVE